MPCSGKNDSPDIVTVCMRLIYAALIKTDYNQREINFSVSNVKLISFRRRRRTFYNVFTKT